MKTIKAIQKKLWSNGIANKKGHYPIDIETASGHRIYCIPVSYDDTTIKFDCKKKEYADILAIAFPEIVGKRSVFFSKMPKQDKIILSDKNAHLFSKNPKKFLKEMPKRLKAPKMTLNANDWYSIKDISENRLLEKQMSKHRIKKLIGSGILKSYIAGKGNGARYYIKGEWIIQALVKLDKN